MKRLPWCDADQLGSATLPLQALMDHLLRDGRRQEDPDVREAFTLLETTIREILNAQIDERKRVLDTLGGIISLALRDISLEEKLQKALEGLLAIPSVHGLDQGAIFLVDEPGRMLRLVAHCNLPDDQADLCQGVPFGVCLCGRAMEHEGRFFFKSTVDADHERHIDSMHPHGHTLFHVRDLQTGRPLLLVNLYVQHQCREDPRTHFLIDAMAMALSVLHTLHTSQAALRGYAFQDPVTGIANRRIFQDRLEQAKRKALRNREAFMVVALGIDRFRHINEFRGRQVGDQVLKLLAQRFREAMRVSDTVARADGDEFIFLIFIQNDREIMPPMQRIRNLVEEPLPLEGGELKINVSIGISLFPNDQDQLLEKAQFALKSAKAIGPGEFQIFSRTTHEKTLFLIRLEQDLRKAIANRELKPYYQPKIALSSMRIIGFEALVRWPDPTQSTGMKAFPDQFIPLAEETGLIIPLGEQMLIQACRDLKQWLDAGYADLHVAVNLAARQIALPTLLEIIRTTLEQTGLPPRHLELEITESQVMLDPVKAREVLQEIRAMGVQLALDDFGTGYSSLATLQNFPFDRLKIDRSFVMNLSSQPATLDMIHAIIQIARSMRLKVTAEGVENPEQQETLRDGDCDDVQGWLYSKALPAEEIPALLARFNLPMQDD
ncbi:MAG: bifunctional diguanylate cyclase/phosphodiesterase [Magnetococcales bacterium]|nr:bifunctional diguanylate cyclase/phosphodiesterase [Magnetococcales bacterium]